MCECGQWKWNDRKADKCDRCEKAWDQGTEYQQGWDCHDDHDFRVLGVDGIVTGLATMLGAEEQVLRTALASLLPQPKATEERRAKESDYYAKFNKARAKYEKAKKCKNDGETKFNTAQKKFDEAKENLDKLQSEEETAETEFNATKDEYWQKFPGMTQNKEDFAKRYGMEEDDDHDEEEAEGKGNRRKEIETGADGESAAKRAKEWGNFGNDDVDFDGSMRGVSG